ncbi:MAG: rhodanese-like domain-containing protein, partial [Candidatus Wallbacteria bacterium]|nr:rhodanese-like domain-containing protein [Candidatus Wallbacteria bacterium]
LDLENNVCPVMGGKSNPALKVELDGVIYRVCCGGCIGMLKKEPDRYLKGFAYEKGGVKIATKEYVRNLISDAKNSAIIIDVLSPEEFAGQHIKGAINLPLVGISELIAGIVPDKSTRIIVYCAGYMCTASTGAAKKLAELGYKNVLDYKGGIGEWSTYYPELVIKAK